MLRLFALSSRWWLAPATVVLATLSACSFDAGTLTAVATHNVNVPAQRLGREVEGSDCVYFLFGIPVSGSWFPNVREAMDNALAHQQGDALENVVVYMDNGPGAYCVRVKGEVVRLASETAHLSQGGAVR